MNVEEVLAHSRAELTRLGTEAGRQAALRFFQEPIVTYGVSASQVKKLEQSVYREVKPWPLTQRNQLCTAWMKSGTIEEVGLTVYLYARFAKQCAAKEFQLFERWLNRYVSNWAASDGVSTKLVAASIANDPSLIPRLFPWTASNNRWLRRAAAVSLTWEARKGRHTAEILSLASQLLPDPDEMVQKGVGWLLKETYPPKPAETLAFWRDSKHATSRLVLRYAAEKMSAPHRKLVLG